MLLANRTKRKDLDTMTKKSPAVDPPARFNLTGILRRFNKKDGSIPTSDQFTTPTTSDNAPRSSVTDPHLQIPSLTFVESHNSSTASTTNPSDDHTYSSFTTECISLPNSEMTSHVELDAIDEEMSPVMEVRSRPLARKLRSQMQRRSSAKESDSESFEMDESQDITAYLSEAESDLDYNPQIEECPSEYVEGGYHPVNKGEVYYSTRFPGREYIALRKLGWGHFSTVWLAKARYNPAFADSKDESDSYVAIKFVKSSPNYTETAQDEIKILHSLLNPLENADYLQERHRRYFDRFVDNSGRPTKHPGYQRIMTLYDDFMVHGPNGDHICMVFEVLGENMLSIVGRYKHQSKLTRIDHSKLKRNDTDLSFTKSDTRKKNTRSLLSLGLLKKQEGESGPDQSTSSLKLNQISQFSHGGIPFPLVRSIVRQLLSALDYIHHCGIIHTDLKPENILMEIQDVCQLIRGIEEQKVARFLNRHGSIASSFASVKRNKNASQSRPSYPWSKTSGSTSGSDSVRSVCSASSSSKFGTTISTYTPSRNSVPGKYESPVRSSKPLSQLSETPVFKDVSYSTPGKHSSLPHASPKTKQIPTVDEIKVKIADMGNATFSHSHFTDSIQTRQYRSPEIILRHKTWGASTDIWSVGCIIFELLTGDYLFDPHNGDKFDKDDDHLAQIIELLGEMPSEGYLMNCKAASKYFRVGDKDEVRLRRISPLKFWGLEDVLVEKYKFDRNDINVKLITDLILKCLRFDLDERFDAKSLLSHPWLNDDLDWSTLDMERLQRARPSQVSDVPGFTSEE
ncbi:hypothetical protein JA9_001025 [Meyerozyma sp. JA9]|nr:hypothetical protein JA9_001025 [Meyerozyma sp. JA9]